MEDTLINLIRRIFRWQPRGCQGCKFLYAEGVGFSDDDREGTRFSCALNRNKQLPVEVSTRMTVIEASTGLIACERYARGVHVSLDVIGKEGPGLYSRDDEQIEAIALHAGRPRLGEPQSWALANLMQVRSVGIKATG